MRSGAQKAQLERIRYSKQNKGSNKENCEPQTSSSHLNVDKHDYERRFRNERKVSMRAKLAKERAVVALAEANRSHTETLSQLSVAEGQINQLGTELAISQTKNSSLKKEKRALRMRVARVPEQRARAVETAKLNTRTFKLKEKGVVRNNVRDMITKLTHHGVPMEHIGDVIQTAAEGADIHVEGSVHHRTTGRIITEAGIAAELQFAEAVREGKSK